ncbi:RB-associated KRAB zinc finger protein [Teleopsis dalmanni]|uniref:RB-associated KRAB zinc finger protein n=1 Tax=Teleopsis dalmanni TaxID=139649 RepID=UPI0018CD0F4F|nr:RB-associated KRAB zinc finger protein [Teleopsis dalmanni]
MEAKRTKYATITTSAVKQELVPVLIQDPNSGEQQYAYAFANAEEAESAVASLAHQQHHLEAISEAHEVIIDENGRAVTIQQLVTDENNTVEEVEAIEEADGTTTFVQFVSAADCTILDSGGEGEGEGEVDGDGDGDGDGDNNKSPTEDSYYRSKTFYCSNCGNCYSAAGSLKLHMRACIRQRQEVPPEDRKCEICNKVFNSVSYLKEHMMRHTGEGPRRCTRCYRKFVDDDKYQAHIETHKQQDKLEAEAAALAEQHGGKKVVLKEFTCSFCSTNFTVVFEAGQVKRRYACDYCREKYSNAEMLKRHKQTVDDKREFPCTRCGRKFVFEGFLQRHIPTCDGTIKRRRDIK